MARILIVEDELIVATANKLALEREGHTVVALAKSSEAGIDAYETHHPDITLIDLNLYNKTKGVDVAAYIREQSDSPIIFTTGNDDAATTEELNHFQNSLVIGKPIKQWELFEGISNLLANDE